MNAPGNMDWPKANQRYLMAAIAVVKSALEQHTRRTKGETKNSDDGRGAELALREAAKALPAPSALEILCAAFRLSPFERDVLLLCAGIELDSTFAACCATAQGDARKLYPTFSLALAVLPAEHWSALSPSSSLRRWRLIELTNNEGLVAAPLRIDERVLHFLTGVNHLDDRLQAFVEPISATHDLPPSQLEVVRRTTQLWANSRNQIPPIVQLCGGDGSGRRTVAALACGEFGLQLHGLRYSDIPALAAERDSLARLWDREAVLSHSALLVDAEEMEAADCARTLLPFLENVHGLLLVRRREPLRSGRRTI